MLLTFLTFAWLIGLSLAFWIGWQIGVVRTNDSHLRWLRRMEEDFGEINPFYKAEADRLEGLERKWKL